MNYGRTKPKPESLVCQNPRVPHIRAAFAYIYRPAVSWFDTLAARVRARSGGAFARVGARVAIGANVGAVLDRSETGGMLVHGRSDGKHIRVRLWFGLFAWRSKADG